MYSQTDSDLSSQVPESYALPAEDALAELLLCTYREAFYLNLLRPLTKQMLYPVLFFFLLWFSKKMPSVCAEGDKNIHSALDVE